MRDNVYKILKSNNVKITLDKNRAIMHNKIFIIDEKTIVTGSYNPTKNGRENNDENMLIIHNKNLAKKYIQDFIKIANY